MRVVLLSDHPGDLLKRERLRGDKQQQRAMAEYQSALKRHEAEVKKVEAARDQARAARRWLAWLRGVFAVRRTRRRTPAPPQRVGAPTDEESKLAAGVAGEQYVADQLGRVLGDDWILFRGYKNARGEIDDLVLGPAGIVAIEVKTINGTIHCDGDSWGVDKYDKYGNLVEQRSLGDAGARHRSPSVQLNEPADALEEFLRSRGQDVAVLRVVLLAHPKSKIGTCRRATVNIFTSASEVTRLLTKVKQPFDPATRAKLEDLIVRDHRHHARRRR